MNKLINEGLMGVIKPVAVGVAVIAIVLALVEGAGKEALDAMFEQAVTAISEVLE